MTFHACLLPSRRDALVRLALLTALAVTILSASQMALAQTPAAPAAPRPFNVPSAAPAGVNANSSAVAAMPDMGDVLKVVDKATASKPGEKGSDWSAPVKLALVFTGLAILPSLLVMMTSFTRIIIVLGFVRRALTTQNIPPTVALVGLALFLTIFTMAPTMGRINTDAIQPYLNNKLAFEPAVITGSNLLKEFMVRQTRQSDLEFFVNLSGVPKPKTAADLPNFVAIPAFAISEFRTAFEMGCLLFIPFLLVDLVISGILLSAGMMMLPPAMISLPFKIILFVLVDGWRLLAQTLVGSFSY